MSDRQRDLMSPTGNMHPASQHIPPQAAGPLRPVVLEDCPFPAGGWGTQLPPHTHTWLQMSGMEWSMVWCSRSGDNFLTMCS